MVAEDYLFWGLVRAAPARPGTVQTDDEKSSLKGKTMHEFEAVPPFKVGKWGWVYDSTGSVVVVCSWMDSDLCTKLYAEDRINTDGHFICECGRLGQRMEEATPERCGLKG